MNKLIFCIGLLASQSANAFCDNWTKTDTALATTALVASVVDYSQTKQLAKGFKGPSGYDLVEMNPLMPRNPTTGQVDRYFVAAALASVALTCTLSPEYRRYFLGSVATVQIGVVLHNKRNGLTVRINF